MPCPTRTKNALKQPDSQYPWWFHVELLDKRAFPPALASRNSLADLPSLSIPLTSLLMQTMAKPNLILRAYHASDLTALVALFNASVHELAADHYDAAQRQAWAPARAEMSAWQVRLSELTITIAEDNHTIAGFIGFSNDGHIDLLFTAPGYARQGVATALYQDAERQLQNAGAKALFTEASLVAQAFFARQGFSVEQVQTVNRGAVTLQRFAMRKLLRP